MCDFDPRLLAAYHDGELDVVDRARVEAHVGHYAACAEELAALRETAQLICGSGIDDLTGGELSRLHHAIDDAATDRPILRLGGAIGVIAASILIVSCAWLMELPSSDGHGNFSGAAQQVRITRPEPWEQMAMFRPSPIDALNGSAAVDH